MHCLHDMTQKYEQAAPPDDGGGQGSFTTPDQAVLESTGSTESIQSIGSNPIKPRHENKGLLLFCLAVLLFVAGVVLTGYYKGTIHG